MDLLKTPSVQSLLDSDLESVESFQSLDIEELDEVEYALPTSEAPTLAEVLSADDDDLERGLQKPPKTPDEPSTCSALQVDFLQALSQQLLQAQERSSAGTATTLIVGRDGRLTVGTAHGHLLSFHDQTLRWVCDSNSDKGAVSCLAYNQDSSRLLAGYARGLICQYESLRGLVLRRVTLGCEIWGTLRLTWAGTSGLVLDTGGSVWLVKFSRPLGVRSARTSCLFSGARGEVVALTARDARILAMATLSRVIIVAGGRASGFRLAGPPDTLPVIEWSESEERVLVCARGNILLWLLVNVSGVSISMRPVKQFKLIATPLWIGWLSGTLAIFDVDENLRLWGDDYNKPLDLSHVEPVYASAFFKGVWTDGRVSLALSAAGASALGGACAAGGSLALLGRRGVVRVRLRDQVSRAHAFICSGRYTQALRLLCAAKGSEARALAVRFISNVTERPHVVATKQVADLTVKLCLKYGLSDELWGSLWDSCSKQQAFVEALGDAAVRGELSDTPPSPDSTQALIERLADLEPALVERVLASLPLTALDPHRAGVFTRERRLWRAFGAVHAALSGPCGALKELVQWVSPDCGGDTAGQCTCAGAALLVAAADSLAGRGAGGRALPDHQRPSARHDALRALLHDEINSEGVPTNGECPSPLRVLVQHDAGAAVRLLEQSAREPPFAGPLAKTNRRRVARALLPIATTLQKQEDRVEILEFIAGQLSSGALPSDMDVIQGCQALAASTDNERADRAWIALLSRGRQTNELLEEARVTASNRPRVLWRVNALLNNNNDALTQFFLIENISQADVSEFFEYLQKIANDEEGNNLLSKILPKLIDINPRASAALFNNQAPNAVYNGLKTCKTEKALEFAEYLLEIGNLKGDAAAEHLRNLCSLRPKDVCEFLTKNSGLVRPEDALAVVKEAQVEEAVPICLEATGDVDGALEAFLDLVEKARSAGDEETEQRLTLASCALSSRASRGSPRPAAAARWTIVLRRAVNAPPAALLEALAYVPLQQLIGKLCSSEMARTIIECATQDLRVWAHCTRVAGRESHEALARSLRAARKGLPVRGSCATCRKPLHVSPPIRTGHCGRACHASCAFESTCAVCGRRVPSAVAPIPTRAVRNTPTVPQAFALQLIAPPRPDLEGIV